MPFFSYVVIDKRGKKIKESVEASTLDTAKSSLRSAGYTILEIKEQNPLNRDINLPFLGNPKAKDMAVFCRQFLSILRSGVPISTVLSMLGQQTENAKLAAAIREMQADIEKGETLTGAMRKNPKIFPNMLVNMVAAGEESGNLEDSFQQMELYFEKAKRTKSAVTRVMIYPCILLVVMIVVLFVMMTKIIPMFLQTFKEMDAELPKLTLMVMAVSDWFVDWWWLLALLLAALVVGGVLFNRTDRGRHFFGLLARKLPVVGRLTVRSACATLCRTLSLLLASGLTLTESLELAAGNMNNVYFKEAVRSIRGMVAEGWTLSRSVQETRIFPPMISNLTGVGEEAGDLQGMLGKLADYYDEEVEEATQRLLAMLEPIVILFMAVFVVIIVFSIFLPMLNMTKAYDSYL